MLKTLFQPLDKKQKKHGALVNGTKLGSMAPLTMASCYFGVRRQRTSFCEIHLPTGYSVLNFRN
jgi:hypothetical protein